MAYIFHIVEKSQWDNLSKDQEYYNPRSLSIDGFIHCAKADQILDVANHLLKNKGLNHLVLLKINEIKIEHELKYEPPFEFPMSEVFYPHIYGPLNIDAIEDIIDFPADSNGNFKLPKIL